MGIDLQYVKGKLVRALTRGDGLEGEDVTTHVKQIKDIPHKLTGKFADIFESLNIRGEIFMKKSVMKELNESSTKKLANTRNAAAGSIRQLDPNVTRHRKLNFFPYTVAYYSTESNDLPTTHFDLLKLLSSLGFKINQYTEVLSSSKALVDYHNTIEQLRGTLDYDIDGVVYKVNNIGLQKHLGFISTEPKWAVAHKFLAEQKTTEVLAIDIQVGRTGKLTPVARVKPIFVSGTTINNITLHNEEETNRKDVRVGDTVIVQRAGDVIPEIVGIVPDANKVRSEPFKMPANCPSCGTPVVKPEDQTDHRCPNNIGCPDQNKYGIVHFVQKKAVEVGNIFKLVTKFSEAFNLQYQTAEGSKKPVIMGCYGIGLSRILGTIVEACHDEKGIIWPETVAPFKVHLLSLNENEEADKIYEALKNAGIEVLYDDRDLAAGEKFVDADLIGCPYRLVISKKTLAQQSGEIKNRQTGKEEMVKISELVDKFRA